MPSIHTDTDALRFSDETDLAALGISTEELTWRVPANLPRKPTGLSLTTPNYDVSAVLAQLDAEQYGPCFKLFAVPCLGLCIFMLCLALVAVRVPTLWLLLPMACGWLVFMGSCIDLSRHRLTIDLHGIHYGLPNQLPECSIPWLAVAGVGLQHGWAGSKLVIMHRQGPDESLSLSGLRQPDQALAQIRRYQQQLNRCYDRDDCYSHHGAGV